MSHAPLIGITLRVLHEKGLPADLARNRAYFDHACWVRNAIVYQLNRFTYLLVLRLFAMRYKNIDRYELFHRAVILGEEGHLGLDADYPLP